MLSKQKALDAALEVWDYHTTTEMPRLTSIDSAMRVDPPVLRREFLSDAPSGRHRYTGGFKPSVAIPDDAPERMWELAWKARTNYLPLLVRVFRQALRVEGYITAAAESPWVWWQRNRMDARQVGLNDAVLKYGAAYTVVLPGDVGPAVRGYSPRRLSAAYADPEVDEWPMFAVFVDTAESHLCLVDEDAVYRFGLESVGSRGIGGPPALSRRFGESDLTFIGADAHGVGVCPVVRYRDSTLLDGEEQFGIIEPLIQVQQRIDETNFGMLVAQYFAAFKQRAVIGWMPESEAEEMKASAARVWYLDVDPKDVRIDELAETDLTRYIESGRAARRDFAALGQIPAGDLGVDSISNISDATLAGLERAKNNRAGEIALSVGESHEQLLRLMAHMTGNVEAAQDWTSEIRWAEREARTWAGQIDGLVKLVQAQIIGHETAVGMVPGLTDQQVEQAASDARRERSARVVASIRTATAATSVTPTGVPSVIPGQMPDAGPNDEPGGAGGGLG